MFSSDRFLVIYVYYEIKNFKKNQTNLAFFIKNAVNKYNWCKCNIDYLFIINGHQCEIIFPKRDNIFTLYEDNTSDWEGYLNGINYIESLKGNSIYNLYDYIYFSNCSVIGPLMNPNTKSHWLLSYYRKIKMERSVICGNIINNFPNTDIGGPGLRISCYNFLLKISDHIINILTKELIQDRDENSIATNWPVLNYNTIIGNKRDKTDAVLTGEYGLSRMLLKHKYNLSCLLYDQVDYQLGIQTKTYCDRHLGLNGENLTVEKIPFFKNIWRWDNNRASLPIRYNESIEIVNRICNFKTDDYVIDYDNLQCENYGKTTFTSKFIDDISIESPFDWKSKEEFYNIHGFAEEIVTFPIQKQDNRSLAIYHHYDTDNIIKDYILISLKCLILSGYDIYFSTSSTSINNVDLPFEIHFFDNYGAGTDFIVYHKILKENLEYFNDRYDWVFITNDSCIFPTFGIDHFKNTISEQRMNSDFWAHWSSCEIKEHLVGTLMEFNKGSLRCFFELLESKLRDLVLPVDKWFFIKELELEIMEYLKIRGFRNSIVISHIEYNYTGPFIPYHIYKWLKESKYFAIKWKYMSDYLNLEYINNPYLNYHLRFLFFDSEGVVSPYQGKGIDIVPKKFLIDYTGKIFAEEPESYKETKKELIFNAKSLIESLRI